jgi:glutamate racemase
MDSRPIGIYDSGIGGLTGLKALQKLLPGEDLVYFGDSGRMPYGPRPKDELCRIARQNLDFLAGFDVKACLAACGSSSSTAKAVLESYPIPTFGVVEPAMDAMAAVPGDKPLAVIATAASIQSGAFTETLRRRCPEREIVGLACPEFAPMIEAGHIAPDDPQVRDSVARSLAPLQGRELGALLLACTHYGIIAEAIRAYLGDVKLLSASECSARALRDYLVKNDLTSGKASGGSARFYVSGDIGQFDAFASDYLEIGPVHAEQTPIMEI